MNGEYWCYSFELANLIKKTQINISIQWDSYPSKNSFHSTFNNNFNEKRKYKPKYNQILKVS
jgi:hypothetical protein